MQSLVNISQTLVTKKINKIWIKISKQTINRFFLDTYNI